MMAHFHGKKPTKLVFSPNSFYWIIKKLLYIYAYIVELSKMGLGPFFFGTNKIMLNKRADKLELLRIAEACLLYTSPSPRD